MQEPERLASPSAESRMQQKLPESEQMTVEEFLAFTAARPDEERWELVEGVAVLNASPTQFHQIIAGNIYALLWLHLRQNSCSWVPLLGVGTRVPVSPRSLPQPDVMVKEGAAADTPVSDEALVLFEVLSPSNTRSDQAWRRRVYASVPNLLHYVTVTQKAVRVTRFDRDSDWKAVTIEDMASELQLPSLGLSMPIAEIYRGTPATRAPARRASRSKS
jgi:Uma2 family endonuclease